MRNCIILSFLISFFSLVNAFCYEQKKFPALTYVHQEGDENCSKVCNNLDMTLFDILLLKGKNDVKKALDEEENQCFIEAFEQAINSIDNLPPDERALGCCIFKDFCYQPLLLEHLLFGVMWESNYGDDCLNPSVDFIIHKQDCSFILPLSELVPQLQYK